MQLLSLLQLVGQVVSVPSQTRGEHWPVAPAGSVVQVPSAEAPRAAVQASQPPEQAEVQHTPSAHAPLAH